MALHFSANQYEQAYKPRVLRNWEVPKQYDDKPRKRSGRTKIISNDRGHLLPGVPKSQESPWGNFIGTWHLPKKISRKAADELNGTATAKVKKCVCAGEKRAEDTKLLKEITEEKLDGIDGNVSKVEDNGDRVDNVKVEETIAERFLEEETDKENIEGTINHIQPYVPGDLTEEKHRLSSHEVLAERRFPQVTDNIKDSSKGYPRYRDDFSKKLPKVEKNTYTKDEVEEMYDKHREMLEKTYTSNEKRNSKKKLPSPIVSAIKNFQLAKKLHKENLEHDPLPDTITNSFYRKLQMQRGESEPGLALNEENFATGVGWKGYPGYGPNKCTKLKVYRPKTCVQNGKAQDTDNGRPSSVSSFDKKWRFIRQRKVSPIELAICWDLTPENPEDEPKRTPHIDGSNGSMAPAVFSLVHTPKEESRRPSIADGKCDSCAPLFEKRPVKDPNDRDFILDRPKTSAPAEVIAKRRTSGDSSQSSDSLISKKRAKSAYNLNKEEDACCAHEEVQNIHQSTPNLSDTVCTKAKHNKNSRLCMACEMKNVSIKDRRPKTSQNDFKMAFKAGVPQKCKDKRQDYPEHWRLATVYQHSYKPMHTRKRPLLATVFK